MSFIQNFFTSRDNNANASTYVGQQGRLWYNPDDNVIYVSDGNTAGGIPVTIGGGGNATFNVVTANVINANAEIVNGNIVVAVSAELGNLTISNQTITGNVADRDVTIATTGNANIEILSAFHVHASGNIESTPEFAIAPDGQTTVRVPVIDVNQGAVEIIGTTSGEVIPLSNPGGMLHITGQNNQVSRLYNDAVNNYPLYVGRRFNGTASAPTGVLADQVISRIGSNPYLTDSNVFPALGVAQINFVATENQTTTSQGSRITMNVTPTGSNVQAQVASFDTSGIVLTGNLIPIVDNIYSLGNVTNRWIGAYFGNAGIYIQDTALGTTGQISLDNGVLVIDDNVNAIQVGSANAIQLATTGLIAVESADDISIGTVGDTGNTVILNAGIKFTDATVQNTAAIPLTQRGNALGVATLDGSGKVPTSQLPAGAVVYKGSWDASTNTPTLANGSGTAGDEYSVSVGGTVNFGAGPITFNAGDFVIYSGTIWEKIPTAVGVTSFNTRTGAVILTSGDVTNALSTGSIVNSKLANTGIAVNTGAGLSGGGTANLGGSLTLTNTGVTAAIAGTGVAVSAATGNVTFSIGQAVGTANSVQFFAVTANTTVQATGNVTGGNIATGGRVVATGNIVTSANVVTPGTIINSSVSTTGNVIGANLVTAGLATATGNIIGGNVNTAGQVSATGNITSAANIVGVHVHSQRSAGAVGGGTLTIDFSTDDVVTCTFSSNFTIAFTNIAAGKCVTVIAVDNAGIGTDVITTGVAAANMTNFDNTLTVTAGRVALLRYWSTGTTTAGIYCQPSFT